MARVTKILHKTDRQRYWVFVDGEYCTSIRERTFPAIGISVGSELSCDEIKQLEKFHWKNQYGEKSWENEQIRLDRVIEIIQGIDSRVAVKKIGFGADTTKYIAAHPEESGKPDLEVVLRDDNKVRILMVEVTGTENRRGSDYWVRPDKLAYCKNNPDEDVWIVLHYKNPKELVVFLKPSVSKSYEHTEIRIRQSIEHYVVFSEDSPEVCTFEQFAEYVLEKINIAQ